MALYRQFCPVYHFVSSILHQNSNLFSASAHQVSAPPGLSSNNIREPTFVTPEQMLNLTQSQNGGARGTSLSMVHGLTTVDFAVRFPNMARQWQQVTHQGRQLWQFQGGNIHLEITLNVFILEGDRPVPDDPYTQEIFSIIMTHELEHVADEIDIVSRWMPTQAYQDDLVRRYLTQAEAIEDRTFRHWFIEKHFSDWLKNGLWAHEHNRRASTRDSPGNYMHLQQQIDRIRTAQVNRRPIR
jgi:hypothetical protein